MNPNKIAFIICANNDLELNEAKYYIERLNVPEGFQTDIIEINGAPSMASGYNAGMKSSDAKYKVYMHQDTFIINKNFIPDMLKVFESDDKIGLMGVVGASDTGTQPHVIDSYDVGAICHNSNPSIWMLRQNEDRTPAKAEAADGLLLATQVDIDWRDDIFDGWDFYDASQCFEMMRHGYRVVIAHQEKPWIYHDNTYSKLTLYEKYCRIFAQEYRDIRNFAYEPVSDKMQELASVTDESVKMLKRLVDEGRRDEIVDMLINDDSLELRHHALRPFAVCAMIHESERKGGEVQFWRDDDNWESLSRKLSVLRFGIKRREYGADDTDMWTFIKDNYTGSAIEVAGSNYLGRMAVGNNVKMYWEL